MDRYKNFVEFYTRSQDVFVNYSLVLDATMSFEAKESQGGAYFFPPVTCDIRMDLYFRFLDENC